MFKPITAGLFGPVSVNARLRELWAEVETLKAEIAELKGEPKEVQEIETVSVQEPEAMETETVTASLDEFDWKTCADASTLKQWALDTFELSIKGNKKAETIRAEISEFLSIEG